MLFLKICQNSNFKILTKLPNLIYKINMKKNNLNLRKSKKEKYNKSR